MESFSSLKPGCEGTARPAAARTGFTARRGGSKSLAQYSRLTQKEKAKSTAITLLSDSSSSSESSTEQDIQLSTRKRHATTTTADNARREAVGSEANRVKFTTNESGQQKKQIPMAQMMSLPASADNEAERQLAPNPTSRKVSLATSTATERSEEQPIHSPQEDVESERKDMARSIITGFPRRALETLLLDAALGNITVMKEVIAWNSKHPVDEEQFIWFRSEHKPTTVENDDNDENSHAVRAYAGLPPTRNVRPLPTKSKPVRPTPSQVLTQESSTDKTIEQLLQAAERRIEQGEEYVPPQESERKRRRTDRSSSGSPPPLEPRTKLQQPLSFLTKDMTHIPLIDIEAYVNRPLAERQAEAENNKVPGKVKRPMNSFMLYRKAYQHRAKEYGFVTNRRVVSQLCGDSWPLEPEEVKAQFAEWARVERENHEEAHPGYKFCPAKPGQGGTLLEDLLNDQ